MLRHALYSQSFRVLEPFFKKAGFSYAPLGYHFRKNEDWGWQIISLSLVQHEKQSYIDCRFGLRLNIVEQLVEPYARSLGENLANENSYECSLLNFKKEDQGHFLLSQAGDLDRLAAHIKDFFRREGFGLLSRWQKLPELHQWIGKNEMHPNPNKSLNYLHYFRALAIASLIQAPDWEHKQRLYGRLLLDSKCPLLIQDKYQEFSRQLATTALN
ncbi:hypothetical protein [Croceimicrobium hydrocarbonivorans]|uniref:DUF4304 domain-containing protein n=1 Tax=Croceimicrobium hydrocarbonivorans TaxID=2761580 RepID=A0A7H0VJQ2_9FLAO|nr:hypothetical protein [Croceimicrobium hydrocarbonivorans]QNR25950.1 hypothetical protein H4K34_08925 [Croceimicrobium hydrocarbonivorans]